LKINTTYWLVLGFLLVNSLTRGQSYSLQIADSLFAVREFEEASTGYERVFYFSQKEDERIQALLNRSYCFKNLNQNYEAYRSLLRIVSFDLSDSLRCVANYQLALNLYLSSYFQEAEKFCARNASIPINSAEYKSSILLHAFVLNELNNYFMAELKFKEYCNLIELSQSQREDLLDYVRDYYRHLPKIKSLSKARKLSTWLPGAGLFYIGKPGRAFANIGFQIFAIGYTAANVYVANYFTAATAGVFLLRSFYVGGINQLHDVVPEVNYLKARKFNDTFRSTFIHKIELVNAR
jgi:hypothetical protein